MSHVSSVISSYEMELDEDECEIEAVIYGDNSVSIQQSVQESKDADGSFEDEASTPSEHSPSPVSEDSANGGETDTNDTANTANNEEAANDGDSANGETETGNSDDPNVAADAKENTSPEDSEGNNSTENNNDAVGAENKNDGVAENSEVVDETTDNDSVGVAPSGQEKRNSRVLDDQGADKEGCHPEQGSLEQVEVPLQEALAMDNNIDRYVLEPAPRMEVDAPAVAEQQQVEQPAPSPPSPPLQIQNILNAARSNERHQRMIWDEDSDPVFDALMGRVHRPGPSNQAKAGKRKHNRPDPPAVGSDRSTRRRVKVSKRPLPKTRDDIYREIQQRQREREFQRQLLQPPPEPVVEDPQPRRPVPPVFEPQPARDLFNAPQMAPIGPAVPVAPGAPNGPVGPWDHCIWHTPMQMQMQNGGMVPPAMPENGGWVPPAMPENGSWVPPDVPPEILEAISRDFILIERRTGRRIDNFAEAALRNTDRPGPSGSLGAGPSYGLLQPGAPAGSGQGSMRPNDTGYPNPLQAGYIPVGEFGNAVVQAPAQVNIQNPPAAHAPHQNKAHRGNRPNTNGNLQNILNELDGSDPFEGLSRRRPARRNQQNNGGNVGRPRPRPRRLQNAAFVHQHLGEQLPAHYPLQPLPPSHMQYVWNPPAIPAGQGQGQQQPQGQEQQQPQQGQGEQQQPQLGQGQQPQPGQGQQQQPQQGPIIVPPLQAVFGQQPGNHIHHAFRALGAFGQGTPASTFRESMLNHFKCAMCSLPCYRTVVVHPCNHRYCGGCIGNYLRDRVSAACAAQMCSSRILDLHRDDLLDQVIETFVRHHVNVIDYRNQMLNHRNDDNQWKIFRRNNINRRNNP